MNAIAHRNYRSNANIQINIFIDRVEIVTLGGLPAHLREEFLGFRSVPRNPLLFSMLYRMGLVEKVGRGIALIRQECEDYGVAKPSIEVSENWVNVIFFRDYSHDDMRLRSPYVPHVELEKIVL